MKRRKLVVIATALALSLLTVLPGVALAAAKSGGPQSGTSANAHQMTAPTMCAEARPGAKPGSAPRIVRCQSPWRGGPAPSGGAARTGGLSPSAPDTSVSCNGTGFGGFHFYEVGSSTTHASGIVIGGGTFEKPPYKEVHHTEYPNDGSANAQIFCDQGGQAYEPDGSLLRGYFLWAYYNNQYVCLDVGSQNFSQGAHILAYPCAYAYNELFTYDATNSMSVYRMTPSYYSAQYNLCFNSSGGIYSNAFLILYACVNNPDEYYYVISPL